MTTLSYLLQGLHIKESAETYHNVYFESFRDHGFVPDYGVSLKTEFARLAKHQGWVDKKGKIRNRDQYADQKCEAFQEEINSFFEDKASKLESWQTLCREVRIDPVPVSISKCKKALRTEVFVNLVDLMNARRLGREVKVFKSFAELAKYTHSKKLYYPLDAAKAGGIVRILLEDFHRRY
ncbi:hypothetical protein EJ05DRAFT_471825 [Pseudovirgaria hyperparasitica]|uniref:Uncharacterized protein n=1 Tax=Pseudovirgaria hyperparasitica TaxID=470096 RepID=A0A6A6WKY6_9PEZI|nr:uncharacterized protein EJ05DRAFT_471825 [Pseudovirgaria hyperparasitica]KAF2762864.1 hypothetical protein EJ05DRAFT_471825 [Pseudovirgaria hyperparasitica]